jgi:hypothetical protein
MKEFDTEANQFKCCFGEWVNKWAPTYCLSEKGLEKDRDIYFPYFFSPNMVEIDLKEKKVNFSACKYEKSAPIDEGEKNLKKLYDWKFGTQYWNGAEANVKKLPPLSKENLEKIDSIYKENSLVSQIYWKHISDPLNYPIFDQRVLRTFLLLNDDKPKLWIKGVPSGKHMLDFYETNFKVFILEKSKNIPGKDQFINLRLIDWALFGFDKLVTKKVLDKEIELNKPLADILSEKIKEAGEDVTKWKIKY